MSFNVKSSSNNPNFIFGSSSPAFEYPARVNSGNTVDEARCYSRFLPYAQPRPRLQVRALDYNHILPKKLTYDEKVDEITRLIGGTLSSSSKEHSMSLISSADDFKKSI